MNQIFAKNIEVGSVVSIYCEDWILCGFYRVFDGDLEIERIMLSLITDSSIITFVHPTHQFTFNQGTYSDSEEFPF